MAPVPLFKVGALILRTLAKPVAARLMIDAKNHPAVARVCVSCGEFAHQITSRINILASGYRVVGVSPLPKEDALNSGVTIVSEFIVFCVAGTLLVYEYNLSERTNAAKAALAAKEKEEAEQKLRDRWSTIDTQLLILADKLQALEKSHAELQANSTAGTIPYSWILGMSANKGGSGGSQGSSSSAGNNAAVGPGRVTENLPSTLEDGDVIEESPPAAALVSGVVIEGGSAAGAVGGAGSAATSSSARTWIDWLMWR